MKKLIFASIGLLSAVAVCVSVFAYQTQSSQNALINANVEALADPENPEEGSLYKINGTSTTYYSDEKPIYTVMVRTCDPGGVNDCTPKTETIYH